MTGQRDWRMGELLRFALAPPAGVFPEPELMPLDPVAVLLIEGQLDKLRALGLPPEDSFDRETHRRRREAICSELASLLLLWGRGKRARQRRARLAQTPRTVGRHDAPLSSRGAR